ncbi:hypothetical protein ABZ829_27865 [Streptomyces xanthochromogenes]|uniref:hypothetical protein n=1 Tax=Streptomyces xanthochromogenes TaxID=67384 RepID=UPI0034285F52
MAKLACSVFVMDPDQSGVSLCLEAGQEVPERLQHLITAPDAWEDGQPPTQAKDTGDSGDNDNDPDGDGDEADAKGPKPAAKKTATAPSRGGRKTAAAEGSGSGQ